MTRLAICRRILLPPKKTILLSRDNAPEERNDKTSRVMTYTSYTSAMGERLPADFKSWGDEG